MARFRATATSRWRSPATPMFRCDSDVRTRFVVFRDQFGDDPVAVIVGTPGFLASRFRCASTRRA